MEPQVHIRSDSAGWFSGGPVRSVYSPFQKLSVSGFEAPSPSPSLSKRILGSSFAANQSSFWNGNTNSLPLKFPQQVSNPFHFSMSHHSPEDQIPNQMQHFPSAEHSIGSMSLRSQPDMQLHRSHTDSEPIRLNSRLLQAPAENGVPVVPYPSTLFNHRGRPIIGAAAPRLLTKKSETFMENSDSSDEDVALNHPNKYAVAIEEHRRPECRYKRQSSRSGNYAKVTKDSGESFCIKYNLNEPLDFDNGRSQDRAQIVKYYRKDLVR